MITRATRMKIETTKMWRTRMRRTRMRMMGGDSKEDEDEGQQ